jgi:hypothetical protein
MNTTVTEELAEAAVMSADDYEKIGMEYCGTDSSPRTTYVISRCDQKWNVGKGVCFPFSCRLSIILFLFSPWIFLVRL